MTHETCRCENFHCVPFFEKGKAGRVQLSNGFPEDGTQPVILRGSSVESCKKGKESERVSETDLKVDDKLLGC
jgi:hypothetical protein